MSYQSKTPNFELPQWVYTDPPQMNDLNTAFANLDSGVQPKTAVRGKMVKADASGNLVEAVDGTDYITGEVASLQLQSNVQMVSTVNELSNAVRSGNMVTVNFGLKALSQINAYQAFAYIPENLKNSSRIIRFILWINNSPAMGNVYGDGGINCSTTIPANATIYGFFSYPISV